MNIEMLSLALDALILICLGFTIYYAIKLSRSLNRFRRARADFEKLMAELNANIEKAYDALENLKSASRGAGSKLQETLRESSAMAGELQFINEVSEGLARRLEGLSGKTAAPPAKKPQDSPPMPERPVSFAIHDREYDEPAGSGDDRDGLESRAERELYEALLGRAAAGRNR